MMMMMIYKSIHIAVQLSDSRPLKLQSVIRDMRSGSCRWIPATES